MYSSIGNLYQLTEFDMMKALNIGLLHRSKKCIINKIQSWYNVRKPPSFSIKQTSCRKRNQSNNKQKMIMVVTTYTAVVRRRPVWQPDGLNVGVSGFTKTGTLHISMSL